MTNTQILAWIILTTHIVVLVLQLLVMVLGLQVIRRILTEVSGWALAGKEYARTAKEATKEIREEVATITQADFEHHVGTGNPRRTPLRPPESPPRSAPGLAIAFLFVGLGATALATHYTDPTPLPDPRGVPPMTTAAETVRVVSTGLAAMKNREYLRAAELLERAAEEGADPTVALGSAAECRFYLRDYDEALVLCDRLSTTVPNCGRAYTVRGLVLLRKGDRAGAETQFRTAARHGDQIALTLIPKA